MKVGKKTESIILPLTKTLMIYATNMTPLSVKLPSDWSKKEIDSLESILKKKYELRRKRLAELYSELD